MKSQDKISVILIYAKLTIVSNAKNRIPGSNRMTSV